MSRVWSLQSSSKIRCKLWIFWRVEIDIRKQPRFPWFNKAESPCWEASIDQISSISTSTPLSETYGTPQRDVNFDRKGSQSLIWVIYIFLVKDCVETYLLREAVLNSVVKNNFQDYLPTSRLRDYEDDDFIPATSMEPVHPFLLNWIDTCSRVNVAIRYFHSRRIRSSAFGCAVGRHHQWLWIGSWSDDLQSMWNVFCVTFVILKSF